MCWFSHSAEKEETGQHALSCTVMDRKSPRDGTGAVRHQTARWSKARLAPDGAKVTSAPISCNIDNAMVKAIARAFRWREMLENHFCDIAEIAAAEKINETYMGGCCG